MARLVRPPEDIHMGNTQPESAGPRDHRRSWVWSVLPLNVGVAGFNTMVPLYILYLGGDVVQVALITTLYNAVLIPASVFWGRVTDRLGRRRVFFVIASGGTTAIFAAMFLLPDLGALAALYAALGLVVTANAVAANLLVMETSERKDWISSYSTLYLTVSLGSIVGVAVGILWTSTLPLGAFLLFCAAATCASVGLSYRLISEPAAAPETDGPSSSPAPAGLPSRLRRDAALFAHRLAVSQGAARGALGALRRGATAGSALLFISAFLFMAGSAFFNTPFVPFLVHSGVGDNEVFAISLINTVAATAVYRWMNRIARWIGGARVGPYSIVARTALCLVLAAAAALAVSGFAMFSLAMAFYALMGLTYASWNSSTSVALLASLGRGSRGSLLGLYAALGALGTVAGSLFTGYVAYYLGYQTTFVVAAAIMLLSYFALEAALRSLGGAGSRADP